MTKAYARRLVKLYFHKGKTRSKHHLHRHLPAVLVVFLMTGSTLIILFKQSFTSSFSSKPISSSTFVESKFIKPSPPATVSARHIFIQDVDTGEVLFQKNADDQLYPASTTKIVTGLVALRSFPLGKIITVSTEYKEGQRIGFLPGEQLTVENLLYALLIESANDAAEILAENYCDPRSSTDQPPSCGRSAFVAHMNSLVINEAKLKHTNFKNPTGLDEPDHYSSAADLGRLARLAMKNPLFTRIVSTQTSVVTAADGTTRHVITNTNELLGTIPGVIGIKTGFTDLAGESVITLVKRQNRTLIFVVMGSLNRFQDTRELIDWGFAL